MSNDSGNGHQEPLMTDKWHEILPVLGQFSQVADPAQYTQLPDDWFIGVSDVVKSTEAIAAGRYKAVNLAGAATISAVANELDGDLQLFIFGGDGARFVVPPAQATRAAEALSRVSMWAQRDLDLELRVGIISVAEARAAGFDVRAAFCQASNDVRYAMFAGGGLEWAETQLKNGSIGLNPANSDDEPNLTGLSCQWGSIQSRKGKILSLIVKAASGASQVDFANTVSCVIALLEESADLNPVPPDGPDVRWPAASIALQSRIAHQDRALWWRRLHVWVTATFIWLIFKFGIRIGSFEPANYRREIAVNTDFRKFDDGLMMTVDCSTDATERLRSLLDGAAAKGFIRYGMHLQDEALMTCVVPSVLTSDHMHFVDGAGGGYAAAAGQIRE
jgi:hypothetical protein